MPSRSLSSYRTLTPPRMPIDDRILDEEFDTLESGASPYEPTRRVKSPTLTDDEEIWDQPGLA